MGEATKALIEVQKEIQDVCKDSVNPHFRNNYASLEGVLQEVRRVLPKHGFAFTQTLDGLNLKTKLLHTSGESMESNCPLILSKQDMQGLGSAITYSRRYSLVALLGIGQADDDAEASIQRAKPAEAPVSRAKPAVNPPVSKRPPEPSLVAPWTPEQMKEFSVARWGVDSFLSLPIDQQDELKALSKSKPFRVAMNDLMEKINDAISKGART